MFFVVLFLMFWIAQTLSCYDALVISMFDPNKTNHIALELQELENVFFFFLLRFHFSIFHTFPYFLDYIHHVTEWMDLAVVIHKINQEEMKSRIGKTCQTWLQIILGLWKIIKLSGKDRFWTSLLLVSFSLAINGS